MLHRHQWRIVSARDVITKTNALATKVVLRCEKCGKLREQHLAGYHAEALTKLD